jgi:predicted GIY-YIG superfamily endonuclease
MPHFFYILSNDTGTVLNTGVAKDLKQRVEEYRAKFVPGIRVADHTPNLVYYEAWDDEMAANRRKNEIERLSWLHKTGLINRDNELWIDLYYELV